MSTSGFDFSLCGRNEHLLQDKTKNFKVKTTKTGTTIVGMVFKDGIVLGADTRATAGQVVADKNCQKIHYIAPNIFCCGAGTAADTDYTTNMARYQLELHSMETSSLPRVNTVLTILKQYLYKYQGHVGAALVVGGFDVSGPHLYTVYPHGSTDTLPYVTMGSGSLAAMSVFESHFKPNLSKNEAIKLVRDAIAAGIFNDLGSGSNVDICVIKKDETEYLRNYETPNPKPKVFGNYKFSTPISSNIY
eukprot:NODE_256_length_12667_cov_0.196292.p4 type:complete len:247 gc:universal NODE_256_length_12667_cov_0.196292:5626-4886(-)